MTEQIKLIIPEGYRDALSLDTKTQAMLCISYTSNGNIGTCNNIYRAKIRGMLSKMPSYYFSKFRDIIFFGIALVSN